MHFAAPGWLFLLILLPVYFIWQHHQQQQARGLPFAASTALQGLGRSFPWAQALSKLLMGLFLVCLIVAVARPQQGKEISHSTQKGIDIMLVLDVSNSMLADDIQPNRLTVAKNVLQEFVTGQQGNRLGVIVFAGLPFTLIPLTTDYALVAESLAEVSPEMIKLQATAIGDALSNAINRLEGSSAQNKVIVLLTDGNEEGGNTDPKAAAVFAHKKGIRVYVIGLGSREGITRYFKDPNTQMTYRIQLKLEEAELQAIAKLSGGLYFRATNQNSLNAIYQQINQMEKTEFEVLKQTVYSERMHWFLLPGLLFFVLALLLQQTRAQVLEA